MRMNATIHAKIAAQSTIIIHINANIVNGVKCVRIVNHVIIANPIESEHGFSVFFQSSIQEKEVATIDTDGLSS